MGRNEGPLEFICMFKLLLAPKGWIIFIGGTLEPARRVSEWVGRDDQDYREKMADYVLK